MTRRRGRVLQSGATILLAALLGLAGTLQSACTPGIALSADSVPAVSPEQFRLTLGLGPNLSLTDGVVAVTHQLENKSEVPVCVGGSQEFFRDDRQVQVHVLSDARCAEPFIRVKPRETGAWELIWHVGSCLLEAERDFAQAFPWTICGAEVLLKSKVALFRLTDKGRVVHGVTYVVSAPLSYQMKEASNDEVEP